MELLNYQIPDNPLRLLDDYLSSISPTKIGMKRTEADKDNNMDISDSENQDTAAPTNPSSFANNGDAKEAEQLHNSVLRVAAELFGNNISLLENSLALLEEQEQYQNNDNNNNTNRDLSPMIIPPIRTIRARRSKRVAVLVRKQRKKSRASNPNQNLDNYYLCLLGRNRVIIDNSNAYKTSNGTCLCTPQHRIGMHCTCRSFFHNIKGSGSASDKSGRSPIGKASYNNNSSGGGNNSIVCKHLLAVILMPHLLPWRTQGVVEDVVDDKVFTKLVMKASIG